MFRLDYRIVKSDFDNFIGENGFIQLRCNDFSYGEMYPKEIEEIMDKVSLYDWFTRLVKLLKFLEYKEYVVLSDVESYNTWIEFNKCHNKVKISIIKSEKKQGSRDIEFTINKKEKGEWENQIVDFQQLKNEIIDKGKDYTKE